MKTRKIPLRCCCITKERLEKKDLFRVVKYEDKVFIDPTYKSNGRGVYLKKDKTIVQRAMKNDVLSKILKQEVSKEIYEKLLNMI
ncbi:MAG: YlxR family protein [Bacilli bacterium]